MEHKGRAVGSIRLSRRISSATNRLSGSLSYSSYFAVDGALHAIGRNDVCQLGLGDGERKDKATLVVSDTLKSRVHHILSGRRFVICFCEDGVYGAGYNETFALTTTACRTSSPFQRLPELEKLSIVQVAAGLRHCLAVLNSGEVVAWGCNAHHQCITGSAASVPNPTVVKAHHLMQRTVRAVACGQEHSVVVCDNGDLVTWGQNANGQCAHEVNPVTQPTKVSLDRAAIDCAAGSWHTLVIVEGGTVLSCGRTSSDRLGRPIQGDHDRELKAVEGLGPCEAVGCGEAHSVALCADGHYYGWGFNGHCHLGVGHNNSVPKPVEIQLPKGYPIEAITLGANYTMALANGKWYATGDDSWGRCAYKHRSRGGPGFKRTALAQNAVTSIFRGRIVMAPEPIQELFTLLCIWCLRPESSLGALPKDILFIVMEFVRMPPFVQTNKRWPTRRKHVAHKPPHNCQVQ